ncbi:hypothetical protein ABIE66_000572 [Peribacillus sp. B2I2]|uniref:hypothetical protein n=1 Tax=Peribacillus sp. B2I2 TaxID=3156468 RepID=UPI0035179CC3
MNGLKGGEKLNFQDGDFERGERPNRSESGSKGEKGHVESSNALGVIVTYFGIMSVFIIIIYYIEKFIMKNNAKRKKLTLVKGI